jgi:NAD(P)-dependent dehydrogenase (short-subunit alcohol dehydrogenase family)
MTDLGGRICMVTGASSGIGKATALELAKMGATVVLVCRDRARGEAALADARQTGGSAMLLLADLSSLAEVRRLASEYRREHGQLHVLINNAAVITRKRSLTVDGLETQFAVNYLAPFLLTNLLLDVLKASAPARVVNVASQVHAQGTINFGDLHGERRYDPLEAYFQSKLANVLFTYALAKRLDGTGVTANCLHPGVIATKLLDDFMGRPGPLRLLNKLQYDGPRVGAETPVYLASSPEVEKITGCYFVEKTPAPSSRESYDKDVRERLWRVSEELTGLG